MSIEKTVLAESRRLLNQARLIAEASAVQASTIGHGRASSQMPPGLSFTKAGMMYRTQFSTLQLLGDAINAAIATGQTARLESVNAWAESELYALTHSPAAGAETVEEFRYRICENYEGELAGVVARREMTSVTTVRKLREQDGRDPRTGYKTKAVAK